MTADAFAVSTDGGKTWNAAWTPVEMQLSMCCPQSVLVFNWGKGAVHSR